MTRDLITIGFDKYGDADFGVRGDLASLTLEEMQKLRAMIPVAIGIAEDMWRREQESKNQAGQVSKLVKKGFK